MDYSRSQVESVIDEWILNERNQIVQPRIYASVLRKLREKR